MLDAHFWEAVAIIIFILMVFKPLKKFIGKMVGDYQDEINSKVSYALQLKHEAIDTLSKYRDLHQMFMEKSRVVEEASRENINKITIESQKKIAHQIEVQKALHKERVKLFEEDILNNLRNQAILRSIQIAKNYLNENAKSVAKHTLNYEHVLEIIDSKKGIFK